MLQVVANKDEDPHEVEASKPSSSPASNACLAAGLPVACVIGVLFAAAALLVSPAVSLRVSQYFSPGSCPAFPLVCFCDLRLNKELGFQSPAVSSCSEPEAGQTTGLWSRAVQW